jgi:hypothetical protein
MGQFSWADKTEIWVYTATMAQWWNSEEIKSLICYRGENNQ